MVVNTTKRQSSKTAQSWEVMGRMGLFSAPGSVLIKTTLLKSLQFVVGTQTLMLSKQWLLADNNGCSDDRISGKPMVILYCKQHKKFPSVWLVLFLKMWFHYSGRSNPAEEIRFWKFF